MAEEKKGNHQGLELPGDEGGQYHVYYHNGAIRNIEKICNATACEVYKKYYGKQLQNARKNSRIVIHKNKITDKEYQTGTNRANQWFYMVVGEAIYDKKLKLPKQNNYALVWHQDGRCRQHNFNENNNGFESCKHEYGTLKHYARAIIYNGEIIKQGVDIKEQNKDYNEWTKSAVGYFYIENTPNWEPKST